MQIEVLSSGVFTTVQDQGRIGYERFGVPQSGAMDWFSLWAANRLVGNQPGAAGLEFLSEGPQFFVTEDCLVAVAGRGFRLSIHGRSVGAWRCAVAFQGEVIQIMADLTPGWGYLAVSGGIVVPAVLGSRSTYLRGGFGGLQGRALRNGDILPVGSKLKKGWQRRAGRAISQGSRSTFQDEVTVPVILGPQLDTFGEPGKEEFLNAEYQISPSSDRMGYRLNGPPIPRQIQSELVSEGIAAGSVQVPQDGQPLVLMSDRPATGGYHKIATIAKVGLPLLAQAMPGQGKVHFCEISIQQAQQQYRQSIEAIENELHENDAD